MKNKGNMYDWVGERWNPLCGKCPHRCCYCYVDAMSRFPVIKAKYSGELRIDEKTLNKNLGKGKTIFVCSMNDLFADSVPTEIIEQILDVCWSYSANTYVFQTKNPERYLTWIKFFPRKSILGTTIETNRDYKTSDAPPVFDRLKWMSKIPTTFQKFITLEPLMDFDLEVLSNWMIELRPSFVNIGADSKKSGLVEPSKYKVLFIIQALKHNNIEVRIKDNLRRIIGNETNEERIAELEAKLAEYTEIVNALKLLQINADTIMERILEETKRGNYTLARSRLDFVNHLLEIKP